MGSTMKLPTLGEKDAPGKILAVLVEVGDEIERDQPLFEVETDKASVEVPSEVEGRVTDVLVSEGDEVESGQELLRVASGDEDGDEARADVEREDDDEDDSDVNEGEGGDDDAEADDEDEGEDDEPRAEREDAGAEPDAGDEGEDDEDDEDTDAEVEEEDDDEAQATSRSKSKSKSKPKSKPKPKPDASRADADADDDARDPTPSPRRRPDDRDVPALASPAVRRLARELGVDVERVAGTGPHGTVTDDDVKSHVRDLLARVDDDDVEELPDLAAWGPVERVDPGAIRRATARSVATSWTRIPHVTQHDVADVTDLSSARERHADDGEAPSLTAVLVKLAAASLGEYPELNAAWDARAEQLVLRRSVHVAVAVDTDAGLVAPVVRDVAAKTLRDVHREFGDLVERARSRDLSPDDLDGATFTLTNLGPLGTTTFTPIVTWPQVAALSVGRARTEPVWDEASGAFVPRERLPLGITYDHRALDGARAARFLRFLAEALSDPLRLVAGS